MFGMTADEFLDHLSGRDLMRQVKDLERQISGLRARQVCLLREIRRRNLWSAGYTVPGLASELDISAGTARALVDTAHRMPELPDEITALEDGSWSFDRATAVARLIAVGADDQTVAAASETDIAGVDRMRANVRRITCRDEDRAHQDRTVRSWPSLDESVGFIHAQLGGYEWTVVNRALDDRADRFPNDGSTREQRRADALVAIAQDSLDGTRPEGAAGPIVTVTIDGTRAADTNGEAGVWLMGGPRIGPDTLDRILCEGSVELLLATSHGRLLAIGPTTRVVPPKVRRFVLARDGGCTIDGCTSRYRLEVHHIIPRSQGGTNDVENLTTLCWWHHHVAVHRQGAQIDPGSPPGRRQLVHTATRAPP